MKTEIAKLKGHTILCGYGKVGKEVAHVFKDEKLPLSLSNRMKKPVICNN